MAESRLQITGTDTSSEAGIDSPNGASGTGHNAHKVTRTLRVHAQIEVIFTWKVQINHTIVI